MHSQTQRLLATIEVIQDPSLTFSLPYHEDSAPWKPWVWDSDVHGEFSPLNLAQQEGWLEVTDPEIALKHWQFSEQQGLAGEGILECDPSCIEDDDAKILQDEPSRKQRSDAYEQLLAWIEKHLSNLQATLVKCHSGYTWAFVVGKLSNGQWLALAPNVPNETPCYVTPMNTPRDPSDHRDRDIIVSDLPTTEQTEQFSDPQLDQILSSLGAIKIYGWYDGGYNHTHDYRLVLAQDTSKALAIEQLFRATGFLEVYSFEQFNLGEQLAGYGDDHGKRLGDRYQHFNQFLAEMLPTAQMYCFCFWDYEHIYLIDTPNKEVNRDCVGIVLRSQFTYNP
jgi:hypothetical protein